jgi:phosphoribosylaminoimidazole carboxylase (NCAIR synthetase)
VQGAHICALIERSLGSPESFPVVFSRAAFIRLAQEEGVRVPNTEAFSNIAELRESIKRLGFPLVLKANGTSGGDGVRVVKALDEAESAFERLQTPPSPARAVKRALVDQDTTLLWPSMRRRRFTVNAQSFVAGRDATSLVSCWNGQVLASLHFEVLNKCGSTGPASVVRLIENDEMSDAITKIASRLSLSGLHGFDFLLEEGTGNAFLIEINPRATQVGHLRLGPGRDLPAALVAAVSEEPVREAPSLTENVTIVLFPQEWKRNPQSAFLKSGYHDVPWEQPDLVRACVRRGQNIRELYVHKEKVRALSALQIENL